MLSLILQHFHRAYQIGHLEQLVVHRANPAHLHIRKERIENRGYDPCQLCLPVIVVYDDSIKSCPEIPMSLDFRGDEPTQPRGLLDFIVALRLVYLHAEILDWEQNREEIQDVEQMLSLI